MEEVVTLKVDTGEAVNSIANLKQTIKDSKQALQDLEIGSEEYRDTLGTLTSAQNQLRDAMNMSSQSAEDLAKENVNLDASYNDLVNQMSALKKAWRETDSVDIRATLGAQINDINDRLKLMDSTIGNHQRNVGNYKSALDGLAGGFGSMGKGAMGIITPIKGATNALNVMGKTPVIAILGLLANLLSTIIGKLKSSEENTNKMSQAMAPLKVIGDAVTKVLQFLGGVISGLVGGFTKLMTAIFGTNKATEERIKLAQMEAELAERQRQTIIQNAVAEKEVARLRAEAADKSNTTATQRIAMLQKAGDLEKQIAARALQDAKLQYQIQAAKNKLTKSSTEELKKEAEAYAAMIKAETNYYNTIRSINAGISQARKQEAREAREAAKAVNEAAQAKLNAQKSYLDQLLKIIRAGSETELNIRNKQAEIERAKAIADAKSKIKDRKALNKTIQALDAAYRLQLKQNQDEYNAAQLKAEILQQENIARNFKKGSADYLAQMVEARRTEYEKMQKMAKESDDEFLKRKLASYDALVKAQEEYDAKVVQMEVLTMQNEMSLMRKGSIVQLQMAADIAQYQLDTLKQKAEESDEEFLARQIAAGEALNKARRDISDALIADQRKALENEMNAYEEGTREYLEKQLELKKFELDSLHQLEEESDADFRARQLAAEKDYQDAKAQLWKASVDTMLQYAEATSSLLDSIADLYENSVGESAESEKKIKAIRIAAATISMIQGAIGAYTQAVSTMPAPAGMIVGALNAATVTAAGLANIAKMRSTSISTSGATTSTSGASYSAAVSAPVQAAASPTAMATLANDTEILNRMGNQRVYILSSDIEASSKARRVQVAETTF